MKDKKDKKELYYVQAWPYGVGCGDFNAYAYETETEAEKKLEQENTTRSDYEEMKAAFGNNFCILAESDCGNVCSRKEAIELNRLSGVKYY